jgi:hypothetical protein
MKFIDQKSEWLQRTAEIEEFKRDDRKSQKDEDSDKTTEIEESKKGGSGKL